MTQELKTEKHVLKSEKGAIGKALILWLFGVPVSLIVILWLVGILK